MPRPIDATSAETVATPTTASRFATSIPEEGRFLPGTLLGGRYRIIGLLGVGGMGEVYRATDLGPKALGTVPGLFLLNGTRAWFSGMLARAMTGVQVGIVIFFSIFGLRFIFRKDWIAALAGAVMFAALQPDVTNWTNLALALAVFLALFTILIFALLRLGLVVAISALFFFNTLNSMTLGTDWSAWYTPTGLAAAAVVLGIALIAFKWSLGNADLLGGEQT